MTSVLDFTNYWVAGFRRIWGLADFEANQLMNALNKAYQRGREQGFIEGQLVATNAAIEKLKVD